MKKYLRNITVGTALVLVAGSAAHRLIVSFFIFFSLPVAGTYSLLFIEILLW